MPSVTSACARTSEEAMSFNRIKPSGLDFEAAARRGLEMYAVHLFVMWFVQLRGDVVEWFQDECQCTPAQIEHGEACQVCEPFNPDDYAE